MAQRNRRFACAGGVGAGRSNNSTTRRRISRQRRQQRQLEARVRTHPTTVPLAVGAAAMLLLSRVSGGVPSFANASFTWRTVIAPSAVAGGGGRFYGPTAPPRSLGGGRCGRRRRQWAPPSAFGGLPGTGSTASSRTIRRGARVIQDGPPVPTDRARLFATTAAGGGTGRSDAFLDGAAGPQLTSKKSGTVKLFHSLLKKKRARAEHSATVIEGHRLVVDVLSDPQTRGLVRHVVVAESALGLDGDNDNDLGRRLRELLEDAAVDSNDASGETGLKVSVGTDEVVNACCDTVTPQGVVAIAELPSPYEGPAARRNGGGGGRSGHGRVYLILDGVSDPGNVGTLLRTSVATGVEAVLLLPGSCDVWAPKTVRGAMGATFRVPVRIMDGWEDCLEFLEEQCGLARPDRDVYAATMEGTARSGAAADDADGGDESASSPSTCSTSSMAYHDVDWTGGNGGAVALCLGREGPGLSREVRDAVMKGDVRSVYVPMEEGIESLNAAVCGSVILFECARQRRMKATASQET